jgi:hypothetical protein
VRGGTYFSLQRQRKVGKRKPLLYLRCLPGYRFGMPQLSYRAATSALCRKPAVNRARREKLPHSLEHIPPQSERRQTHKTSRPNVPEVDIIFRAAHTSLRAFYGVFASLRDSSKNMCCGVILAGTGGLKRLSFAYFSLPLQRKVGAAPHRGNA